MKKLVVISSIIILIYMFTIPAYAANISDGFNVDAKTSYEIKDVVVGVEDEKTGELVAKLPDGVVIKAKGRFSETIRLMVMPIRKETNEEWNWLQSITKTTGVNKSAYYFFFMDDKGKRVEAGEGCEISVKSNVRTQNVHVYYITSGGLKKELKSFIEDYVVKFNMVRNGFYTLTVRDSNKDIEQDLKKDEDGIKGKDKYKNNKDNKDNKDNNDEDDKKDNNEDEKDKSDDQEDVSDGEKEEDGGDGDDEINDDDAYDSDDSEEVQLGSGTSNMQEKEPINWGIIIVILIIMIIIFIIFIIISRKKKKEDED